MACTQWEVPFSQESPKSQAAASEEPSAAVVTEAPARPASLRKAASATVSAAQSPAAASGDFKSALSILRLGFGTGTALRSNRLEPPDGGGASAGLASLVVGVVADVVAVVRSVANEERMGDRRTALRRLLLYDSTHPGLNVQPV